MIDFDRIIKNEVLEWNFDGRKSIGIQEKIKTCPFFFLLGRNQTSAVYIEKCIVKDFNRTLSK